VNQLIADSPEKVTGTPAGQEAPSARESAPEPPPGFGRGAGREGKTTWGRFLRALLKGLSAWGV
jgi:hypothetical protein